MFNQLKKAHSSIMLTISIKASAICAIYSITIEWRAKDKLSGQKVHCQLLARNVVLLESSKMPLLFKQSELQTCHKFYLNQVKSWDLDNSENNKKVPEAGPQHL